MTKKKERAIKPNLDLETPEPDSPPKRKSRAVMPATAARMANRNIRPGDTRYTGKRVRQSAAKRAAFKRRERRLNRIGWSLYFFAGGQRGEQNG